MGAISSHINGPTTFRLLFEVFLLHRTNITNSALARQQNKKLRRGRFYTSPNATTHLEKTYERPVGFSGASLVGNQGSFIGSRHG